ncbi:MAG: hypothetical protein PUD20_10590, partial [bacterium]|nr:hypothetical protein [bacterium]
MRASLVEQILKKRKIIIAGYHRECMEFCLAFQQFLDIVGYIDFNRIQNITLEQDKLFEYTESDMELREFQLDQIDTQQYYIVLCNGFTNVNWSDENKIFDEILCLKGFEYEDDYIDAIVVYRLFCNQDWIYEFQEQEVLIFGCGKCGQTFYKRFCENYHIVGFLS